MPGTSSSQPQPRRRAGRAVDRGPVATLTGSRSNGRAASMRWRSLAGPPGSSCPRGRPARRRAGRRARATRRGRPRRRSRNGARRPVFCSKTISSCPHGIATRYCVLTPTKLDVADPAAGQDVGTVVVLGAGWASRRSSPAARPASPRRPWCGERRRVDRRPSGRGSRPRPCRSEGPVTLGHDQVRLTEEVRDERRLRVLVQLRRRAQLLDHARGSSPRSCRPSSWPPPGRG